MSSSLLFCPDNRAFVKRGALNELWDSLELKGVEKSSYLRNKEKYFFYFKDFHVLCPENSLDHQFHPNSRLKFVD